MKYKTRIILFFICLFIFVISLLFWKGKFSAIIPNNFSNEPKIVLNPDNCMYVYSAMNIHKSNFLYIFETNNWSTNQTRFLLEPCLPILIWIYHKLSKTKNNLFGYITDSFYLVISLFSLSMALFFLLLYRLYPDANWTVLFLVVALGIFNNLTSIYFIKIDTEILVLLGLMSLFILLTVNVKYKNIMIFVTYFVLLSSYKSTVLLTPCICLFMFLQLKNSKLILCLIISSATMTCIYGIMIFYFSLRVELFAFTLLNTILLIIYYFIYEKKHKQVLSLSGLAILLIAVLYSKIYINNPISEMQNVLICNKQNLLSHLLNFPALALMFYFGFLFTKLRDKKYIIWCLILLYFIVLGLVFGIRYDFALHIVFLISLPLSFKTFNSFNKSFSVFFMVLMLFYNALPVFSINEVVKYKTPYHKQLYLLQRFLYINRNTFKNKRFLTSQSHLGNYVYLYGSGIPYSDAQNFTNLFEIYNAINTPSADMATFVKKYPFNYFLLYLPDNYAVNNNSILQKLLNNKYDYIVPVIKIYNYYIFERK